MSASPKARAEMFGKLMSISDELMWKYYALLTDLSAGGHSGAAGCVTAGALHPKAAKVELATRIVGGFSLRRRRPRRRRRRSSSGSRRERSIASSLEVREWVLPEEPQAFRQVLIQLKLAASGAEADQKLKQGAVKVDGRKVNGPFEFQSEFLRRGEEHVVEVGRRAFLLRVS